MLNITGRKINKAVILGVAGGGVSYLAKFFKYCGCEVSGYDLRDNEITQQLSSIGVVVHNSNPDTFAFAADIVIYTNALPASLIKNIQDSNDSTSVFEVSQMYTLLMYEYESQDDLELCAAIKKANLAPLYDVDTSGMLLIGVTGTKGKTTTIHMLEHMLTSLGKRVGVITTIGARILNDFLDTGLHVTTPSPIY
jgi:UDP-N-acetylmuramate-alanine ligase